jgi:hypothetical protein
MERSHVYVIMALGILGLGLWAAVPAHPRAARVVPSTSMACDLFSDPNITWCEDCPQPQSVSVREGTQWVPIPRGASRTIHIKRPDRTMDWQCHAQRGRTKACPAGHGFAIWHRDHESRTIRVRCLTR